MSTAGVQRLGLKAKRMADGPHGVRKEAERNCTAFPNLCLVASTWDTELIHKMGVAVAKDCIHNDVDMLLGPGVNIKRHALCGRNFEYFSEDPVLAGEMAAAYINGLQSLGVAASLKHFAVNNQEKYRLTTSVDADMRTLMEIYLKAFEIAIKKSSPATVMCAYNKLHSIWCSENKFLLTEILRDAWGYEGVVISDWGAVQNPAKSLLAGLDLRMPGCDKFVQDVKESLKRGEITEEDLDVSVKRVIELLLMQPEKEIDYNRNEQHKVCREIAAEGMVLLKNCDETLPITPQKYKKVAVIGEFAKSPLILGQGSAEVLVSDEYIDSPVDELCKLCGDEIEFKYMELYRKDAFSKEMLWPKHPEFSEFIADTDLVIMFVGAMESEDTEKLDRRCADLNQNYEMFINFAVLDNKKVVVVNQSGSAMTFGEWTKDVHAVVQMWLGGESAGGAIADVLCGVVTRNSGDDSPKVIESTEIISFDCELSFIATVLDEENELEGKVYKMSATLEDDTVKSKIDWYDRTGAGDKSEFETDISFMSKLQEIVSKYNLAQHNGYSHRVSGLPNMYGECIDIKYASGESIYAFDNQSGFISMDALVELIDLFSSFDTSN